MAKLNEEFFSQLEFSVSEKPAEHDGIEILITCTYNGIYRQYDFVVIPQYHEEGELPQLIEQGKRIVAWSIDAELNRSKK